MRSPENLDDIGCAQLVKTLTKEDSVEAFTSNAVHNCDVTKYFLNRQVFVRVIDFIMLSENAENIKQNITG